MLSIAASHILMPAAALSLAVLRRPVRFPPFFLPLAIFCGWTLLAAALAEVPREAWGDVRKFYVWFLLPGVVYSTVRTAARARALMLALGAGAALSSAWALVQFARKYAAISARGDDFYAGYVADRITGFTSHWMTFSGEMVVGLSIVTAFVLFGRPSGWLRAAAWMAGLIVAAAQVLAWTRSMWAASAVAVLYLIWRWRPRFLLTAPVAVGLVVAFAPAPVASRIQSIWNPSARDSNDHRYWLRETGARIVAAHPLVGIGPRHVKRKFSEYVPPEAPKPWPIEWYYQHLHNTYLHWAAERGLPALAALLWMLVRILLDLSRAVRGETDEARRFVLHAAIASVAGLMVGGWWEVNLGDSEVLGAFLAVVTCGYAARREDSVD